MDNVLEELLTRISILDTKVGNFTDLCQRLEEKINSCDEKLDTIIRDCGKDNSMAFKTDTKLYKTNVDDITERQIEIDSQDAVYRKKKEMLSMWKTSLNQRKQAYWNAIRSEQLADIYEKWMKQDNIILPMKYRVKNIKHESAEETQVRINLAKQKMEADITLLRIRLPKYRNRYEECDQKMEEQISENTPNEIKEKVLNLWKLDISREAAKSEQILETKRKWLENYEESYGHEKVKTLKGRNSTGFRKRLITNQQENQENERSYADVVRFQNGREFNQQGSKQRQFGKGQVRHDLVRENRQISTNERNGNSWDRREIPNSNSHGNRQHNSSNHFLWRGPYQKGRYKNPQIRK